MATEPSRVVKIVVDHVQDTPWTFGELNLLAAKVHAPLSAVVTVESVLERDMPTTQDVARWKLHVEWVAGSTDSTVPGEER